MINMSAEMKVVIVTTKVRIASVRSLSMTCMSVERRSVMWPVGVVSKKDIGARRTRVRAFKRMVLLALVPAVARTNAKVYINIT